MEEKKSPLSILQENDLVYFPGLVAKGHYQLQKNLSSSLFGIIKVAKDIKQDRLVCIKISLLNSLLKKRTLRHGAYVQESISNETLTLKTITSSFPQETFFTHLIDTFEDTMFHYLVTEYIESGDLFEFIVKQTIEEKEEKEKKIAYFTEEETRQLMFPFLKGILKLHEMGIAHRDISLENILIDVSSNSSSPQKRLVLCDFGVAWTCNKIKTADSNSNTITFNEIYKGDLKEARPGKTDYSSIELLLLNEYNVFLNDMYGIGVVLFTMLTGLPPYNLISKEGTIPEFPWTQRCFENNAWFQGMISGKWITSDSFRNNPLAQKKYGHLSEDALDILKNLICFEERRFTVHQLLQHPFFYDCKFT